MGRPKVFWAAKSFLGKNPGSYPPAAHTQKQRIGPCSDALFRGAKPHAKRRKRGAEMKKIEAVILIFGEPCLP